MHNNYYFLRLLSAELEKRLVDTIVSECFSQFKDELIIRFEKPSHQFLIKASLQPELCCLSFPTEFHRARKNSVDLFKPILGERVLQVQQYENERSFSLILTAGFTLLFKMHGNRANVVLFQQVKALELFRNHLTADETIVLHQLHRSINWSEEAFEQHHHKLPTLYFTFGKYVWNFLDRNNFSEHSKVEQWLAIQDLLKYLRNPSIYVTEIDNNPVLTLFPEGNIVQKFNSPIEALNEFYNGFTRTYALRKEKQEVLSPLKAKLANTIAYLVKAYSKKKEIEKDTHYKNWADILMANLHGIQPGAEKVVLPDFYHGNKPVEIKLKRDLSAQKNAEIFYRKSKNHHIEIQKLTESIASKEKELKKIKETITDLERISDLKSLREFIQHTGLKAVTAKKEAPLPFHETEFMGFKIWIGKNAQHNDTLTLRHTFKDDLWLHAKDVPGSHVVVKYQSGKIFPKEVIERAAQLAAFHSKRKTESLCPVAFTPKKYVRKRKGDPAGAVVVDREEVILVEPRGFL